MTDTTKYRNVSLSHATYKILNVLSKNLDPDVTLSISKTIEKIANDSTEKVSKLNISLSDNKNWKRIEEALLGVVEASNGTANNIYDRNIRIAGKTGTAQVKSIGETEYKFLREDESLRDHALFVGYGPVEDPKLVVVAIIELSLIHI